MHFAGFVQVEESVRNPKKYFDNNKKPSNLILVYSNPIINKPIDIKDIPQYFDKTFMKYL